MKIIFWFSFWRFSRSLHIFHHVSKPSKCHVSYENNYLVPQKVMSVVIERHRISCLKGARDWMRFKTSGTNHKVAKCFLLWRKFQFDAEKKQIAVQSMKVLLLLSLQAWLVFIWKIIILLSITICVRDALVLIFTIYLDS